MYLTDQTKSFLYPFKGSNCVYELKGDPSPVMLKEIFHDSFENFKITRICMENHWKRDCMAKVVFLIQMLPTFSGRCNCYFWDIWLKICRLPNFNMLFKPALTKIFKVNCFRVDWKLITWSSHAKSLIHSKLMFKTQRCLWNFQKVQHYCVSRQTKRKITLLAGGTCTTLTTPFESPAKRRPSSSSQHSAVTVLFLCSSDRRISYIISIVETIRQLIPLQGSTAIGHYYHYTQPNDKLPSLKHSFSQAKWQRAGCKWNLQPATWFHVNNLSLWNKFVRFGLVYW